MDEKDTTQQISITFEGKTLVGNGIEPALMKFMNYLVAMLPDPSEVAKSFNPQEGQPIVIAQDQIVQFVEKLTFHFRSFIDSEDGEVAKNFQDTAPNELAEMLPLLKKEGDEYFYSIFYRCIRISLLFDNARAIHCDAVFADVFQTLQSHLDNENIVWSAIICIATIFCNSDQIEKNAMSVLPLLKKIIPDYINHKGIIFETCRMITNILCEESVFTELFLKELISSFVLITKTHLNDPEIAIKICDTITNCNSEKAEINDETFEFFDQTAMAIYHTHSENIEVINSVIYCLKNLFIKGTTYFTDERRMERYNTVIEYLNKNYKDLSALNRATDCICTLMISDSFRRKIVPRFIKTFNSFFLYYRKAKDGNIAFSFMIRAYYSICKDTELAKKYGKILVQIVFRIYRWFPTDPDLLYVTIGCICHVLLESTPEQIFEYGIFLIPHIVKKLRKYYANTDLLTYSCNVLSILLDAQQLRALYIYDVLLTLLSCISYYRSNLKMLQPILLVCSRFSNADWMKENLTFE